MLIPLTNEDARRRALEAVQAAKPGWVVSISKPNRSTAQNSLYWAVLQEISEQIRPGGQGHVPETWHIYFKTLYLPGRMKSLPGGQMVELEPTTTGMTTAAFSEYVEQVIAWASDRGMVWTSDLSAMRVERDTMMQLPSIYQTEA